MLPSGKLTTLAARPPGGRRHGRPAVRPGLATTTLALLTLALIGLLAVPVAAAPVAAAPATGHATNAELTREEVSFRGHGGLPLHGTVIAPAGAAPARPGMVLVHGSGPHPRTDLLREAEAFARGGIATLVSDKRTVGYSMGERDYSVLAEDALAAVRTLRAHDGVDPASVGLWGVSEGGWVVPLAASRSSDVAFLVTVAANGRTPSRQQVWANDLRLRDAGVSRSLLRPVRNGMRLVVAAGAFPEAHYDPVPVLERVRQPVLALWGELDKDTPPRESARIFQQVLGRSGNRHVTIRFFAGAEHALHRAADGGHTRLDELAPGYPELVTSWVHAVAAGRPPASSADPAPPQERETTALAPPAWWESPLVALGAVLLILAAFASYPVTAVARRLAVARPSRPSAPSGGRPGDRPAAWPARWLAAAGPVTVLGAAVYLVSQMTGAAQQAGPVVAGRPVVWLALQVLAVGVVAATVATAVAWRRARATLSAGARARLGLLLAGGVVFVPWALYWGLLVP